MARIEVGGSSEFKGENEKNRNGSDGVKTSSSCGERYLSKRQEFTENMTAQSRDRELVGETSLSGEEEGEEDKNRGLVELVDDTLDDLTLGQVASEAPQVAESEQLEKQRIEKISASTKRAYVETSLDDLSYASSSESEKDKKHSKGNQILKLINRDFY